MPDEMKHDLDTDATTDDVKDPVEPRDQKASAAEKSDSDPLQEKMAALEAERDHLKESLLRKAADFENFRRQKDKEIQAILKYADEGVVKKLLPVIDDLDRVLINADKFLQASPEGKIYVDGVRLVQQKFLKLLEERGVKKLDALGQPFNIDFHEAVLEQVSEAPAETVIQEFEPGYVLHDKVIRHAKVVVSKHE